MSKAELEYLNLPSYKLVIALKRCKFLLRAKPEYKPKIAPTINLIKTILIERQVRA